MLPFPGAIRFFLTGLGLSVESEIFRLFLGARRKGRRVVVALI